MKKGLFALLFLGSIFQGRAQKIIEKHMDFSAGGLISMDFQISDSIHILTWNKNEVYIRSSIKVDVGDSQENDAYKMSFEQSGKDIVIRGKLELDGDRCCGTGRKINVSSKEDSTGRHEKNCCCCCSRSDIIHTVYIPEDADISVETINGNIVITGKIGAVRAHSISGYVDLAVALDRAGSLEMKTITGTMYSNYELPADSHKPRRVGGGSVFTELNGGKGKRIDLETISGDIFLRKAG
ncbi:MAG TPA: hypothetical protein VFE32_15985 [Puia sp.]|jgi:hypothetical protein|nr:hypothetical protein [Puia sp.]